MSQTGASSDEFSEDGLLAAIFPEPVGLCLEVGAFDGLVGSTTLAFERRGWRAILVEPLPELAEQACARRRGPVYAAAAGPANGKVMMYRAHGDTALSGVPGNAFQAELHRLRHPMLEAIEVPQFTLDHMLAESGAIRLDFATIDVEGFEAQVLAGFDLRRWAPRVVILEDNSRGLDPTVSRIMARRGYRRFCTIGVNDWYARVGDRELLTWRHLVANGVRLPWKRVRAVAKCLLPSSVKGFLRRNGVGY